MLKKKFFRRLCSIVMCLSITLTSKGNVVKAEGLYSSVRDFIVKSYSLFLGRENLEDEGINYWSYIVENHNESLYNYIISMISSEEFLSRDINNEEFLNIIYNLFLGTNPSEEEKNYWIGKINEKVNSGIDEKTSRIEVSKEMFNEGFFSDFSYSLGTTPKFKNLNSLGVSELKESYGDYKISYINSIYKDFNEIGKDIYDKIAEDLENTNLSSILSALPLFSDQEDEVDYEDIKRVTGDGIERLVYALDYEIEFPHDQDKSVYISPFIEMKNENNGDFITLCLSVTSRGIGKEITKSELILGNNVIELETIYKDHSKYDDKGISLHEFEVKINSIEEFKLLDMILSSDLSKIRLTYDGNETYLYSLYDKDRVRNTLRFMTSIYSQIIIPYLFEKQDLFNRAISQGLNN